MNRLSVAVLSAMGLVVVAGCTGKLDLGQLPQGQSGGSSGGYGGLNGDGEDAGCATNFGEGCEGGAPGEDAGTSKSDGSPIEYDAGPFDDGAFPDDGGDPYDGAFPEDGGFPDDAEFPGDAGPWFPGDAGAPWEAGGGISCAGFGPSCTCSSQDNGHSYGVVCEANDVCNCFIDNTLTITIDSNLACGSNALELYSLCGFPTT